MIGRETRRSCNTCRFPHKALGNASYTAETDSFLFLSFNLFRGRKWIEVAKSPGPRFLQYPSHVLHCDLGFDLIWTLIISGEQNWEMKRVHCSSNFTFNHQNDYTSSFRCISAVIVLFFSWDISNTFMLLFFRGGKKLTFELFVKTIASLDLS